MFLKAAGTGAVWTALTGTLGCQPPRRTRATVSPESSGSEYLHTFRSRPDLSPPSVDILTQAHNNTAPGYIFLAPKKGPGQDGPLILDDSGEPVWFRPLQSEDEDAMDFKVQHYRGEPVLTWWEGVHTRYGQGDHVILDSSYREIKRLQAAGGYKGDHHEFLITPQDTAFITIYNPMRMDLSSFGPPKEGLVLDGIAQEIDIEGGEVLFEWHSLGHVDLQESYYKPSENPELPFDYFHINSIDVDHDNNLLISARQTSSVYKIDRKSGEVIWRLGGKNSDFEMGPGTRTRYQHDARRQPDGTITIFDNGVPNRNDRSYGIVLDLDEAEMTATLKRKYPHPKGDVAASQGNMQVLHNSNVFIGWGSSPLFSEFSKEGELLFNARFPPGDQSYRAFRFPWSGQPSDDPAVVAVRHSNNKVTLYASWNGATEVATWEVLAGPRPKRLKPVGSVPRHGFETAITVRTAERYVGVRAKDGSGRVLGASKATKAV